MSRPASIIAPSEPELQLDEVAHLLAANNLSDALPKLRNLGVDSIDDLRLVQEDDLTKAGFPQIQVRKLMALFKGPGTGMVSSPKGATSSPGMDELRAKVKSCSQGKDPKQQTQWLRDQFSRFSFGKATMNLAQFKSCLQSLGISENGAKDLLAVMDTDKSGSLDAEEMVIAVFGPMSPRRGDRGSPKGYPTPATNAAAGARSKQVPVSAKTPSFSLSGNVDTSGVKTLKPAATGRKMPDGPPVDDAGVEKLDVVPAMLEAFRKAVLKRCGKQGLNGLSRRFRLMDKDKSGTVGPNELKIGMRQIGFKMDEKQYAILLDAIDTEDNGSVTFDEFMIAVRGQINDFRKNLIMKAFSVIDKDGSGLLTIDDIQSAYNAKEDEDVKAGRKTEDEVLREFLDNFDGGANHEKDGKVTKKEFLDYYKNVSASIDRDDYFELMIRNAWHIPGGEGASANTANTRVLAEFENGTQRVVCIEDDLGLDLHNQKAVLARLKKQGLKGVVGYKLSG